MIGKEFNYTTWGMTMTSAHGSINQKWIIEEEDEAGTYFKCRLIWSEAWGRLQHDYTNNSFKRFPKAEVLNILR